VIVETDLGHDPDDLFALCYLAAAGTEIAAVTIVPGDPDQLAVARLLAKLIGRDIPVGASKLGRTKPSSGGVHHRLLDRFGVPRSAEPDGPGDEVIAAAVARHPDAEFFVIGPCTSTARYLARPDAIVPRRVIMQGGFLGYHLHAPAVRRPEFEGREWVPTFNLNGDRRAAGVLLRPRWRTAGLWARTRATRSCTTGRTGEPGRHSGEVLGAPPRPPGGGSHPQVAGPGLGPARLGPVNDFSGFVGE
jgi:pyrimidine-specific ribonucleoside hydrolase